MPLGDWISARCFNWVHQHNLVYNTCWEDPRLDRQALKLGPDDTVAMITSAGCNALDYVLQGPRAVHTIDVNPRQNALLELKKSALTRLDYNDVFGLFGEGKHPKAEDLYLQKLRRDLSPYARRYWDKNIRFFNGRQRPSFYFFGTSGALAWSVNSYIDKVVKLRGPITELLEAKTLDQQREIYHAKLKPIFWTRFLRWAVGKDMTLAMLGVPRPQRKQVDRTYPGGIVKFIEDCLETVFTDIPLHDNYFWRVYLTGSYTKDCCPEYLKEANYAKLHDGLVNRVQPFTGTLLHFFETFQGTITRFVLLDHMDWLSSHANPILRKQWQALVDRAHPASRILWRSGGLTVDFVDPIEVQVDGKRRRLGEVLRYDRDLAERLHKLDRVHTYGSFYIADLNLN